MITTTIHEVYYDHGPNALDSAGTGTEYLLETVSGRAGFELCTRGGAHGTRAKAADRRTTRRNLQNEGRAALKGRAGLLINHC